MRIIFGFVFLTILMFSVIGYFPLFKLEQWKVRVEMKNKLKSSLSENLLHKIKFSSVDEIHWIRKGKEFMIGNRLYDIVKKDPKQPFTFYCIHDVDESKLFVALQREVSNQTQDPNQPFNKAAKQFLKLTYLLKDFKVKSLNEKLFINSKKTYWHYINNYQSIELLPQSPPPSIAFHV